MKKNNLFYLLINPSFVFASLFLLFIVVSFRPFHAYDEGLWTYAGRLWNTYGIAPYVGVVENKTPGILILYSLADFFGNYNIVIVRSLGVISSFFTLIMLYHICLKLHSKYAAIICAYLFGLTTCWSKMDGFSFAQTETFMIFFSVLAFYVLVKKNQKLTSLKCVFICGLSLGGAIAFKQIAITTIFSFVLIFLLLNKTQTLKIKLRGLMVLFFGIGIATFFSYLPLLFYKVSFLEYLEGAWLILFNTGSKVQNISEHLYNFANMFLTIPVLYYVIVVVVFIWKRKLIDKNKLYKFMLIWLFFDFLGTNASGYYYGHQIKQLLPSLSIIGGICFAVFIPEIERKYKKIKHVNIISVLVIIAFFFPYKQFATTTYFTINGKSEKNLPYTEVVNFVRENSVLDDYIYVLGGDVEVVQLLAKSQRRSSSRYINSIFITQEEHRKEVENDVNNNFPKFIFKHNEFKATKKIYGQNFVDFLNQNYKPFRTFNEIDIYEMK